MVKTAEAVHERLKALGYESSLINARFAKPLDEDALPHWELAKKLDIIDFDLRFSHRIAGKCSPCSHHAFSLQFKFSFPSPVLPPFCPSPPTEAP